MKKGAFFCLCVIALFISCGNQSENGNGGENGNSVELYNDAIGYEPVAEQAQENSSPAPTPGFVTQDAFEHYGILLEEAQVNWEEIRERPEFRRRTSIQIAGNRYVFVPDESFFPWDNIAGIYSSSEAEEGHSLENLLDRTWQSWAVRGGVGETFTVEFNAPMRLDRFWIRNGNGQLDQYFQNNRIKAFEIFLDDEEIGRTVNLRDTHELGSYGFPHLFMPGFLPDQVIMVGTYVMARRVRFKITELFYGTHHDTTFISEIFFGSPPLWGPRWGTRRQLNDQFSLPRDFRSDPFTTSLIGALYESYGIPTRLNSDNQLEIYAGGWDWPPGWFTPRLYLTDEVAHMHFTGTGAGQAGHRYRIFLSPDFPPILIIVRWSSFDGISENELYRIQLFNGTTWEDHNDNPAILPILSLKEDIQARGFTSWVLFEEFNDRGGIEFAGQNSLIVQAVEIGRSDDGWPFRDIVETHRFLWNGKEFEPQ